MVLLYYILTLNSATLVPGNFYLNNFLLAFMEIPGTLIGLYRPTYVLSHKMLPGVIIIHCNWYHLCEHSFPDAQIKMAVSEKASNII